MERRFRLTRSSDFKRVRSDGKSYAHPLVVLLVATHETGCARVGVTAGRSMGTAVDRNRAKRLLREALRDLLPQLPPSHDLVCIAREPILRASFTEVREALRSLFKRAKLISPL